LNTFASGTDVIVGCGPITWIDGNNYAATNNTATFTLVGGSVNGCDSVVTLDFTLNTFASGNDIITSCTPINWIDGNNYAATNNTATHTIVGGSSLGCDSIVTLDLTINPVVTSIDVQTACNSYTWIDGNNYTASNNTATHTIIGGSSLGCDSNVTLDLTINMPITTIQIFVECQGFSTTVGTNTYNTTGIFTDIVNNCDTIITDLTINSAPTFTITKAEDNCGEEIGSIAVNITIANPPITYNWSNGGVGSEINNLPIGIYTITITDNNGCSRADTISIQDLEIDCEFFVYLPNVFTPNGDGNNDILFAYGKGIVSLSFKIYNRWGNKVFETNEINQGWDGTHNGTEQNTAVFVYVVEATFLNGKTVTQSGDVSLVK
jgi:gliding motility-associated-like protein